MNEVSTGSAHLKRKHFFNEVEDNVDIPDGDVELGKKLYKQMCAGCHILGANYMGPDMTSIFGKTPGKVKGWYSRYSPVNRSLVKRWSKERLFTMLKQPQAMFGLDSGMAFDGLSNVYERACLIEYLHFLKVNHGKGKYYEDYYA